MKATLNFLLLPIVFWAACVNPQKATKDFVPGTYVTHAQSEYSVADDTVQITPDAATENNYRVIRRTGFSRIKDGQLQVPQYKVKSFTALWDAQKLSLQLTQNGTVLLFRPDSNQLVIENSIYHKLKD